MLSWTLRGFREAFFRWEGEGKGISGETVERAGQCSAWVPQGSGGSQHDWGAWCVESLGEAEGVWMPQPPGDAQEGSRQDVC